MGRTVNSPEQARRKRLHYGLFFLGAFMLAAAVVLAVPTMQYQFEQGTVGDTSGGPGYEYEYLTPQEQRVVDGALDGETYTFETSQPLPGAPGFAFEPSQVKVTKQGATHTFTYRVVFPAGSPKGMATIALIVGGLLTVVEAVRRHHFPSALPW
jgi:hypothetical protein